MMSSVADLGYTNRQWVASDMKGMVRVYRDFSWGYHTAIFWKGDMRTTGATRETVEEALQFGRLALKCQVAMIRRHLGDK